MTLYTRSKKFHKSRSCQGTAILSILIIVSICLLGFFYVLQVNGVVGQGYEIREQKEALKDLELKNKKLQIETARLQFPASLEEIAQNLNMVEVGQVTYLKKSADVAVKPANE